MGGLLFIPALCGEVFWSAGILAALGKTWKRVFFSKLTTFYDKTYRLNNVAFLPFAMKIHLQENVEKLFFWAQTKSWENLTWINLEKNDGGLGFFVSYQNCFVFKIKFFQLGKQHYFYFDMTCDWYDAFSPPLGATLAVIINMQIDTAVILVSFLV